MKRKEITFRHWFNRKYGNIQLDVDKREKYALPKGIAEIDQSFKNDFVGYSLSFNSVMKYARNIESEVRQSGSYELPPLQEDVEDILDLIASDNTKANNINKHEQENAFELNIETLADVGEVDVKLFKTDTIIDNIDSDFEEGGGQYGGTVTIVVGESGSGKTTFLLDKLAKYKVAHPDAKMLFISTEMTRNDLQFWVKKMPHIKDVSIILAMSYMLKGQLKQMIDAVFLQNEMEFDLIVLDSFQDLLIKFKEALGWRESTAMGYLVRLMIQAAEYKKTAIYAIQHATKSGTYVGSTYLKHTTTAMLHVGFFKGSKDNNNNGRRCVYYSKNRRGGSMQGLPIFFDMDKENGEIVYDETEFYNALNVINAKNEARDEVDKHTQEMYEFIKRVQEADEDNDNDINIDTPTLNLDFENNNEAFEEAEVISIN